jgi:hypothetical protein
MTNNESLTRRIESLRSNREKAMFKDTIWKTSAPNYSIRISSTSHKGDFGEAIFKEIIDSKEAKDLGFKGAQIQDGTGPFDVLVSHETHGEVKVECKLATMDTNGGFQFNGIRKSREYDILYCVGVGTSEFYHTLKTKAFCKKHLTTVMEKGNKDGFKYSVKPEKLLPLRTNEDNLFSGTALLQDLISLISKRDMKRG